MGTIKNKVQVFCDTCGKPKMVSFFQQKMHNYCGKECRANHKKETYCATCGCPLEIPFVSLTKKTYCSEECRENRSNHLYKVPYPERWKDDFKETIRDRDDHVCQKCGNKEEDRKLSVHHIDYMKGNLSKKNLISLCLHCHMVTNGARRKWTDFFHKYMCEKYGYKY